MALPWYRSWFYRLLGPNPLHSSVWRGRLSPITFRPYHESDLKACLGLYNLNAPDRFPPLDDPYEAVLTSGRMFTLIGERNGLVVAAGSVQYARVKHYLNRKAATLCFGLVHPEHQNQGIGTALVLARLALLRPTDLFYFVLIYAVVKSIGFYSRLGFREITHWTDCYNQQHPVGMLEISRRQILDCRKLLTAHQVSFPPAEDLVPLREALQEATQD